MGVTIKTQKEITDFAMLIHNAKNIHLTASLLKASMKIHMPVWENMEPFFKTIFSS